VPSSDLRWRTSLGFGPLVAALVVCGGLTLVAAVALARAEHLARTLTPRCGASSPLPTELKQGDVDDDRDPTDSSDDDDDDDDDSPDMLVAAAPRRAPDSTEAWSTLHEQFERWLSVTMDGHSLRGPPCVQEDILAFEDDTDDRLLTLTPLSGRADSRDPQPPPTPEFNLAQALLPGGVSLRAPPAIVPSNDF
jgi:hypothetical protein